MPKPDPQPEITIPLGAWYPNGSYIWEDDCDRGIVWYSKPTIEAGQTITFTANGPPAEPKIIQGMCNTVVRVELNAGNGKNALDGVELWTEGHGYAPDFVPAKTPGVKWDYYPQRNSLALAICAHSHDGPNVAHFDSESFVIKVRSTKRKAVTLTCSVIYKYGIPGSGFPVEYEAGYGVISGPFNEQLCKDQGMIP